MSSFARHLLPVAFLMFNAWMLAAAPPNYLIIVAADSSGNLTYTHQTNSSNFGKGSNGVQEVSTGETIQWQCGKNCVNLHVLFERKYSPCGPNNDDLYQAPSSGVAQSKPCTVADGTGTTGYVASYPYNIAVYWNTGGTSPISGVALVDPDVIVDNGPTVPQDPKSRKRPANGAR